MWGSDGAQVRSPQGLAQQDPPATPLRGAQAHQAGGGGRGLALAPGFGQGRQTDSRSPASIPPGSDLGVQSSQACWETRSHAGPTWIPGPHGGEGRRGPAGLGQHVPACPAQGRWPWTCLLAAGTAGHSWAHSASVGPAAPSRRAQAEWQGRCVGPWCSRAPGGPARGPPVLGVLSHRQTGHLVTGRVTGRLTLGSCPPGTFPGMACPLTRVSHVSPVISVTAAGQGVSGGPGHQDGSPAHSQKPWSPSSAQCPRLSCSLTPLGAQRQLCGRPSSGPR